MSQVPLLGPPPRAVGASNVFFEDSGGDLGGGTIDMQAAFEAFLAGLAGAYLTVIGGGKGTVQSLGNLGATETIDLANANLFLGTLNADCTIGFTGWTNGKDCQITVELTQDGTGGWTPTFSGVTWIGGTPTWITTAGTVTHVVLFSRDGGTTIYGAVVGGGAGSSALPWFNVMDYGAVGDGVASDKAAVNAAIAARNAAGGGVLYFPKPPVKYLTDGLFDPISTPGLVFGDGRFASIIDCTSTTEGPFSITVDGVPVRDLGITHTGAAATAGAGITTLGGLIADIQDNNIWGFYDGLDIENMLGGVIRGNFIQNCRRHGIRGRNTAVPDAGDAHVAGNLISSNFAGGSAVRWESSGGLRLINNKVNGAGAGNRFTYGFDVEVTTGVITSVGIIMGNSVENVESHAVRLVATGSGSYGQWIVDGLEVGLLNANNAGRAIYASAITNLNIDNIIANTTGTARAAIELVGGTARVGWVDLLNNFTSALTTSGGATVVDHTGGIGASVAITGTPSAGQVPIASSGTAAAWGTQTGATFVTPAIVLGTAAAAGAAATAIRSDSTIVAFDATVPTTIAAGDAAAAGSAAVAARRDHQHGAPAAFGIGELLISDTPSTPLVFADLLQNEAEDDLLYADV